jgi:hypothetical protein
LPTFIVTEAALASGRTEFPKNTQIFRIDRYELPRMLDPSAALLTVRLGPSPSVSMNRLALLQRAGLALTAAAALSLTACSQAPTDTAKQAAEQAGQALKEGAAATGEAAKQAATATGQAALAPALNPLIDLLSKSQADIKSGNLGAAVTAMGGFQSLWDKAGPVIQPLAGDKWGAIDTAAKGVISTFGGGTQPNAAAAGSAITGLLGPLSALAGK